MALLLEGQPWSGPPAADEVVEAAVVALAGDLDLHSAEVAEVLEAVDGAGWGLVADAEGGCSHLSFGRLGVSGG